jgi:hypothetical protein
MDFKKFIADLAARYRKPTEPILSSSLAPSRPAVDGDAFHKTAVKPDTRPAMLRGTRSAGMWDTKMVMLKGTRSADEPDTRAAMLKDTRPATIRGTTKPSK